MLNLTKQLKSSVIKPYITGLMIILFNPTFTLMAIESLPTQLPTIVVSASHVPLPIQHSGSAITVLNATDLQQRQVRLVSDVLRDIPGLAVNRTGNVGALTQVRIRGAEANHTLVIIDGIEMNNPSGGSEYDFANLLAADVERIEVLRGPQSALYGSDAIGGVINIITKQATSAWQTQASIEGQSTHTYQINSQISANYQQKTQFSLALSQLKISGISAAEARNGNDEIDPYQNLSLQGKVSFRPIKILEIGVAARFVNADIANDGFAGGIGAIDANNTRESRQRYRRAFAKLTLLNNLPDWHWTHVFSTTHTADNSDNLTDNVLNSQFDGSKLKTAYQTNVTFDTTDQRHGLTLLIERERDAVTTSSAFANLDRSVKTLSYATEYRLNIWDQWFFSASLRRDDNDALFPDQTTYRVTHNYLWSSTATRLHASLGTGVKNPSLFELFGFSNNFTGNPNLKPEQSRGWDVGVEQTWFQDTLVADVTYFKNRIDNLITGSGNSAINLTDRHQIDGIEMSLQWQLSEQFALNSGYTRSTGKDVDGNELVRRPKHIASAHINYRFFAFGRASQVNLGLRYHGSQNDVAFDENFSRSIVRLDDYTLVNLAASYQLKRYLNVFARVENLLDQQYQEVYTYGTPGITAMAGFRFAMAR